MCQSVHRQVEMQSEVLWAFEKIGSLHSNMQSVVWCRSVMFWIASYCSDEMNMKDALVGTGLTCTGNLRQHTVLC